MRAGATTVSWLAIWCPLDAPTSATVILVQLNRSLGSILHRVGLLAILVAASGIMHVKVGSSWQTSTLDFGAEEFTHRIISQLFNSQLLFLVIDSAGETVQIASILLINLGKRVRHEEHHLLPINRLLLD